MIRNKAGDTLGRFFDSIQRGRKTAAQITLPAGTKSAAGHTGDFLLFEQLDGKLPGSESSRFNTWKGIKRAARQVAFKAHAVERVHDVIAAQPVLVAHLDRVGLPMLDRFEGGLLADNAGAEHRVRMN